MRYTYKYETFRADSGVFDREFTQYLNERASQEWRVRHCNYCHGSQDGKMHASCMFEQFS
jgi:hypothetical protein